jgi:putative inorganic carbon (HCO3(-)) transporter
MKSFRETIIKQDNSYSITFFFLIFFSILVFAGPQRFIESLEGYELNLGEILGYSAVVFYILSSFREILLLLIFFFLATMSVLFSPWSDKSLYSLIRFGPIIIIFILLAHAINSVSRMKKLIWVYIICSAFVAYFAIQAYLGGIYSEGERIGGAYTGINSGPNEVARTLALTIPFALSFYLISKSKLKQGFYLFFITVAILALICTYSRAGLLTLIVVFGWFFLKRFKQKGVRIIVPVVFLLVFIPSVIPTDFSDRLSTSLDLERDASARARWGLQEKTIEVILENPITGVGIGMNELVLSNMGKTNMVHNIYMVIASEIGIPALIIFLILSYRLVKIMRSIQAKFKEEKEHQDIFYIAMALEISLIGYFLNGLFSPAAYKITFYYLAGLIIALNRITLKYNNDTRTFLQWQKQ